MQSQQDSDQKEFSAKKKYAIITPSVRMAFIKRVLSKQATIKQAAMEFGIKFSTSKAILQTYRKEGRVGKKKTRQRKVIIKIQKQQENVIKEQEQVVEIKEAPAQLPVQLNQQIYLLQQQMAQQLQLMQMNIMTNPYMLLPQITQNTYLNQYAQQIQSNPLQLYQLMQAQQLNTTQQMKKLQQFGQIEDVNQYQTPLQSSKCLEEGRATLKDFN